MHWLALPSQALRSLFPDRLHPGSTPPQVRAFFSCVECSTQRSDPKCIDEIGRGKASYLKLGELSFGAVKFALSDPAARVATEPVKHQASYRYIRSIHFDGGRPRWADAALLPRAQYAYRHPGQRHVVHPPRTRCVHTREHPVDVTGALQHRVWRCAFALA